VLDDGAIRDLWIGLPWLGVVKTSSRAVKFEGAETGFRYGRADAKAAPVESTGVAGGGYVLGNRKNVLLGYEL